MAGFKEQIKAKFKAKFPGVNLTNQLLDVIVDKLDAKTDTEDTIETQLDELNELIPFAEIAKDGDRVRKEAAKAKPKPADPAKPDPKPNDPPEDESELAKFMREMREAREADRAEILAIKGEKTIAGRKATLTEKLKDAPESFRNAQLKAFNRMSFTNDEEFTDYLAEIEADVTEVIQEQSNAGLGKDKPAANFGKTPAEKEVSADMKQYLAENAPKPAAATT